MHSHSPSKRLDRIRCPVPKCPKRPLTPSLPCDKVYTGRAMSYCARLWDTPSPLCHKVYENVPFCLKGGTKWDIFQIIARIVPPLTASFSAAVGCSQS